MAGLYKIGEFAEKLGVTIATLRRWDKEGKLKPAKVTDGGTRYYSEQQYQMYTGSPFKAKEQIIIGYARVSIPAQKDALERQVENIKTYMCARGYQFEIVTDVGSGVDCTKKGLIYLLDKVMSGNVAKIVILHKDRLAQFGFELIQHVCEFNMTEIEIIDSTKETEEEELVADLVQIITVFSVGLTDRRRSSTKRLISELKDGD